MFLYFSPAVACNLPPSEIGSQISRVAHQCQGGMSYFLMVMPAKFRVGLCNLTKTNTRGKGKKWCLSLIEYLLQDWKPTYQPHCSSCSFSRKWFYLSIYSKGQEKFESPFHMPRRQLFFSYFPATTFVWLSQQRGCWRKFSPSAHHIWAALCPGAHICNPGTLQSFSLGFGWRGEKWMQEDGVLVTQVWGQTGFPMWAQMMDGSGLYMMLFYFWQLVMNYPEPGIKSSANWFRNTTRLVSISILPCQY